MAYVDWKIKGPKIGACSCDYGCPCEFNGLPSEGLCEGLEAQRIDEGWFGDVRLDGLLFAARFHWPGPVHEGRGTVQAVIDKRATPEQIDALSKILDGEEQEPTTIFNIYCSTVETELDPVFRTLISIAIFKPEQAASRLKVLWNLNWSPSAIPSPAPLTRPKSYCRPVLNSVRRIWLQAVSRQRVVSHLTGPGATACLLTQLMDLRASSRVKVHLHIIP